MKIKYGKIYLILWAAVCVTVSVIFIEKTSSFDDVITHPTLARKSVELFNESSENKISSTQEISWIMQGAREEDTPIRWMNHFYNPATGYGLAGFSSAKNWTEQSIRQSFYPKGDQTWQKAIDSYVKGDRQEAFIALGHNLHLIEDMAVPAHTRIDIHLGDPFENWAKNNSDWKLAKTPITKFSNLEEYFNSLANYSNKYFLSEDTINENLLKSLKVKTIFFNNKNIDCYIAYDSDNKEFCIISGDKDFINPKKRVYYLTEKNHSDYYSLLAPKAISYGAGMIDLFFKEVERKREEEAKKSLLDKLKSIISSLYPKSIEINRYNPASFNEVEKEIAEKIGEVAGAIVREGGRVLSAKITADDLFKPGQTEASDNFLPSPSLPSKEKEVEKIIPPLGQEEKKEDKAPRAEIISSLSNFIIPSGGDNIAPETTITSQPEIVSSSSLASFIFASSEANSSFEYNLNNNGWKSCGDALGLVNLADGQYIIEIRAFDKYGNIDRNPAVFNWVIDTISSNVIIASGPDNFASSTNANFQFEAGEELVYKCQLDGGEWGQCLASTTINSLNEGEHIFSVKGIDMSGNISSSTVYNWLVDITAPTSTINNLAENYSSTGFTVSWEGSDTATTTGSGIAGYDAQYKIESGDWQEWISATSSVEAVFDLAVEAGKNIYFRVRAYDKAGNIGEWSSEAQTKIIPPLADHIVISELVTRGPVGAWDEFVELYNPTGEAVNLEGWKLQTKPAAGGDWTNRTGLSGLPAGIISSHGYYLLAAQDYSLAKMPDYRHSANWGLADSGGHLRIINNSGEEIDKIGYGDAIDPESQAFIADLSDGSSLERKAAATSTAATMESGGEHEWSGNGYDSDNNGDDFILKTNSLPQSVINSSEPRLPVSENLINLWHFDECEQATSSDSLGSTDLRQNANWTVGKWDCALNQSCQIQYDIRESFVNPISSENLTLSYYWRNSAHPNEGRGHVFLKNNEGEVIAGIIPSKANIILRYNNASIITGKTMPDDNQWHNIVLTYNSNSLALYIDGALNYKLDGNFNILEPITIFEMKGENYPIERDEIAIWGRALGSDEIGDIYSLDLPLEPYNEREPQVAAQRIHYWGFDEGSGTVAFDTVGSDDLTINSALWVAFGKASSSISQFWQSQYYINKSFLTPIASKDLSIDLWWRNSAHPNEGRGTLILKNASSSNVFGMTYTPLNTKYYFNASEFSVGSIIPSDSAWHHLALVYDSYQYRLYFYVDGVEKISQPYTWFSRPITGLEIKGENWDYELDELNIWSGALSPGEVLDIYQE